MNHNALTNEQIRLALSYCDVEDQEIWVMCGMAVKSEIGEAGREMWLDWSATGSSFKLKEALTRWKSFNMSGRVRIGSLIFEAQKYGFKLEKDAPKVSPHVQEQRRLARLEAERLAKIEEQKTLELQAEKAKAASYIWRKAKPCESHPYLVKKDVLAHGCKVGEWSYRDDNEKLVKLKNVLIVPMYYRGEIVAVQGIAEEKFIKGGKLTDKLYMYGAQKSGAAAKIGNETDCILICEGWATGATLHEATQLCVYIAFDSGNLLNVAKEVRKQFPLHKIIICADNDQYKKTNTGIKAAEKTACAIDADIIYPIFKDVSSKPTDFNDLYMLEGYSPIIDLINPLCSRSYNPKPKQCEQFDAFKLSFIENAEDTLETSIDPLAVACAGLTVAMRMSENVPAFVSIEQIRKHLDHPLIHHNTHRSIMCRVHYAIQNRKRRAMTAIKPVSWNKHNHTVVTSLDEADLSAPINVIFAPMGAGKTQKVIKPFSESVDSFVAVAHRRSLISDLSETLNIKSYDDSNANQADKLAICLPSTQSIGFRSFIKSVSNIAIDEISQNIRFTASKECKVIGSNQEDIFNGLRTLVNECKKVVVCDASIDQTTIDFLETARPDEQLNIIEQVPNNRGRECYIYTERADFLTKVQLELESGGKVWLAVESAIKAEVLAEMFKKYNLIAITSKNSKNKKIKQFLENVNEESRKYDLVIASPAISSGVSVEHKKPLLDENGQQVYDENGKPIFIFDPHFTMIAGMASGHSICFSDFAQMLGRVRYVDTMHVCLQKNTHRYEQVTTSSILTGLRQASALEGATLKENDFTRFKAHIDIVEQEYRADFANGFIWFMQYYCFDIEAGKVSSPDYLLNEKMKEISKELKENHRLGIKLAKKISKDEAKTLDEKQSLTDDEEKQLIAYKLRVSFNFGLGHDINDLDLDMFENMPRVDRFARILGLTHPTDDADANIALRRFEKAQVKATADIFEGIDFDKITSEDCDKIFERISSNDTRFLYSSLKLIPSAYGKWQEDKSGNLKPYPKPKITTKPVATVLDKFGLGWKRSGNGSRFYRVNECDLENMTRYAKSRYEKALN